MTRTSEPPADPVRDDPRRALWELHARHATRSSVPAADVVEHILSLTDRVLDDAESRRTADLEHRRDTTRIRVRLGSLAVVCSVVGLAAFLAGAGIPPLAVAGAGLMTGVALLLLDSRSAAAGHRGRAKWSGAVLIAGLAGLVIALVPGGWLSAGICVVVLLVTVGGFASAGSRAGA